VGHLKASKESCFFAVLKRQMIATLLGLKQDMGSRFDNRGNRMVVTSILAEPNVILSTTESKVTLGFDRRKKAKKTDNAYVKIAGFAPRFIKEAKLEKSENQNGSSFSLGSKVTVSIFAPGDLVKVTGITKGRGFAGGVKRWGFAGGPKTHGQSDRHRAIGSIGQATTPGRVFRGKKMPGHMGVSKLTVTNLEVIEVDEAKSSLLVKGSVPGARGGFLILEKTGKAKGYTPPPEEKKKDDEETATTEDTEKKTAIADSTETKTENTEKSQDKKSMSDSSNSVKSETAKEEENAEK